MRDKVLITRDDERGYRLHLSIKTQAPGGGDMIDRATNEVVSTPLVIPLTPEQVTKVLRDARTTRGAAFSKALDDNVRRLLDRSR